MNTLSKSALTFVAALLLAGPAFSKSVDLVEPKLVGLYFHASWCAACKKLDPAMDDAAGDLKKSPFLLVKLDVSNKVTQHQAGMTAAAMGFGDIYKSTGLKTGFIILVDPATGKEVGRITKSEDASAITGKIKGLTDA
ncbi:TlpA family protein disulfide reductase [Pelagicoccus mobilis]|uniref:Thioredoxin family protein n=1 Tax=Pelagicoccus mobilis TaxID=415221 RepID=A0A934S1M4_9BACT|nr:thioredoxin family protein [Pelagicoccus mobilis]MBK1880258.1 thioredoxin family protein [Pelagicoccus mobilis]